jgi:hypothetical protein
MASTQPDTIENGIDGDGSEVKEVWCLKICPFREAELLGPSGLILTCNDAKYFQRQGIFKYITLLSEKRVLANFKRQEMKQCEW